MSTSLTHIHTSAKLNDIKAKLDRLLLEISGKVYKNSEDVLKDVKGILGEEHTLLGNTDSNQAEILNSMRELAEELDKFEIFNINLAFVPSEAFISELHKYVTNLLKNSCVLDFTVDSNLVGGLSFDFRGKFHDFTLASKVETSVKKVYKNALL